MAGATTDWLKVEDHPIATYEEVGRIVYAVPEEHTPPTAIMRFAARQAVSPVELYEAAGATIELVASSESALAAVALVQRRLLEAFRDQLGADEASLG